MILRRSKNEPLRPEWQRRFDEAASMIRQNSSAAWVEDRLATLEQALRDADADRTRLAASIQQLDADGTARQLKDALRDQQRGGLQHAEQVATRIRTLRHRYDVVNDLLNRRDALSSQIAHAVSDVEVLAVSAMSTSTGESGAVAEQLERLNDDLAALEAARAELRSL